MIDPNAKPLKLALLVNGLDVTRAAEQSLARAATKRGHGLFSFAAEQGSLIPQELWLDAETVVRLHPRPRSPYALDACGDGLVVRAPGGAETPVRLSERPAFYDARLDDGSLGSQHCQINGADRLNVYVFNYCSFTHDKVACRFCNVSDSGGQLDVRVRKRPDRIAEVVALASAEGAFRHVCFSGGATPDRDRACLEYVELCRVIRRRTGLERIDGDVSLVPPADVALLDALAPEVTTVSMNLEVVGDARFAEICPGKHRIGLEHYRRAFERAVAAFGRGHVRSNLVLGLEPLDDFRRGTRALAELGVVPTTNVYWQATSEDLLHPEARDPAYYAAAYAWLGVLYQELGFTPPWCSRCTIASMDHETAWLAPRETL